MECHMADFACDRIDRVGTMGVGGQYAVIDREHGYRFVFSVTYGTNAVWNGVAFERSIEPLLNTWAALGQ